MDVVYFQRPDEKTLITETQVPTEKRVTKSRKQLHLLENVTCSTPINSLKRNIFDDVNSISPICKPLPIASKSSSPLPTRIMTTNNNETLNHAEEMERSIYPFPLVTKIQSLKMVICDSDSEVMSSNILKKQKRNKKGMEGNESLQTADEQLKKQSISQTKIKNLKNNTNIVNKSNDNRNSPTNNNEIIQENNIDNADTKSDVSKTRNNKKRTKNSKEKVIANDADTNNLSNKSVNNSNTCSTIDKQVNASKESFGSSKKKIKTETVNENLNTEIRKNEIALVVSSKATATVVLHNSNQNQNLEKSNNKINSKFLNVSSESNVPKISNMPTNRTGTNNSKSMLELRKSSRIRRPSLKYWLLTENDINNSTTNLIEKKLKQKNSLLKRTSNTVQSNKAKVLTSRKIRRSFDFERSRKKPITRKSARKKLLEVENNKIKEENYDNPEDNLLSESNSSFENQDNCMVPEDTLLSTSRSVVKGKKRNVENDLQIVSSKKIRVELEDNECGFKKLARSVDVSPGKPGKKLADVILNGNQRLLSCYGRFPRDLKVNRYNPNLFVGTSLDNSIVSTGFLEIAPLGRKKYEVANKFDLILLVLDGIAEVGIGNSVQVLRTGQDFFVPKGTAYYVINVSNTGNLMIYFCRF